MGTVDFLRRAAEKTGYTRERYLDVNVPSDYKDIVVFLFFVDVRSAFIISTLLLHRWMEKNPSKYVIVCSHPRWAGFFSDANEFWALKDPAISAKMFNGVIGFDNIEIESQIRELNKFFENVIHEVKEYYDKGLTSKFFEDFKEVVYKLPDIGVVPVEFNRKLASYSGFKVVILPSKKICHWNKNKEVSCSVPKEFWLDLSKNLLYNGITPVVIMDEFSYDISSGLENKAIYLHNLSAESLLSHIRSSTLVLDVFQGLNRLATMARCPFLSLVERNRFSCLKDGELNDLTCIVPHKYIFSFPTVIESMQGGEIISYLVKQLTEFAPTLNRDNYPSTLGMTVTVPYSIVRKKKRKKLGTKFIKVERL